MDLPTYTSIWRIEKRLYKLYDFRLPMPLPIGQLTVFVAITVPYVLLLTMLGLPFSHSLIWLYVLPPGVLTWLATRPVLESKRLPELIGSQLRYLAEPRIWCRMAPQSEHDVIRVSGRVRPARRPVTGPRPPKLTRQERQARQERLARQAGLARQAKRARRARRKPARRQMLPLPAQAAMAPRAAVAFGGARPPRPAAPTLPPAAPAAHPAQLARPPAPPRPPAPERPARAAAVSPERKARPAAVPPERKARPAAVPSERPADVSPEREARPAAAAADRPARPAITVVRNNGPAAPLAVESAIAGPAAQRGSGSGQRVVVIPGGHRPGKPDRLQRDRSRARLPISGPRGVVLLGCTVGAGQTTTALLLGEVLASARDDTITVLDLNPNAGSATRRAVARPALSQAASLGPSRLRVLGSDQAAAPEAAETPEAAQAAGAARSAQSGAADDLALLDEACETSSLVLADPATPAVPRLIAVADQLVLVAPATAAAAGAITMTIEWLEAHGHGTLAGGAILVLNGVSRRTMPHVEAAERVAAGRCRAIVRVPWDDQLNSSQVKRAVPAAVGTSAGQHWTGVISPPAVAAYTALAGVLVASLAGGDPASGTDPVRAGR